MRPAAAFITDHPDRLISQIIKSSKVLSEEQRSHIGDGIVAIIHPYQEGKDGSITKVFPDRIEKAIYAEGSVELCCAVGIPDEIRINYPRAIIVLKKDFGKSEETKQRSLDISKSSLPDYIVPDEIEIRDELPRTARGKVDYRVLEQEMVKPFCQMSTACDIQGGS